MELPNDGIKSFDGLKNPFVLYFLAGIGFAFKAFEERTKNNAFSAAWLRRV
jgi:hypothetical protein